VATWWSPFVDGPTGYCTPAGSKGYLQPLNDFATIALGEAVPSNYHFVALGWDCKGTQGMINSGY
jgi:hypothetical protein